MNFPSPYGGPPTMHDPYGMMPPPPAEYSYLGPPQFQPNPAAFEIAPTQAKPLPLIPPGSHGPSSNNFRLGRGGINTNSKDPMAMKSRVFVGNLNTSLVTREQLIQVFAPFGEILAVSIHKGYAFIQYGFESEARNAVSFTDGTMIAGKRIDVNIASEPKPTGDVPSGINKRSANVTIPLGVEPTTKRQKVTPSTNRASTETKKSSTTIAPPTTMVVDVGSKLTPTTMNVKPKVSNVTTPSSVPIIDSGIKQETLAKGDDIIICGQCRHLFPNLDTFAVHKQSDVCYPPTALVATVVTQTSSTPCQTTAETNDDNGGDNDVLDSSTENGGKPLKLVTPKVEGEPETIQCFICHDSFDRSWDLLVHISQKHNMTVYEVPNEKNSSKPATSAKKLF